MYKVERRLLVVFGLLPFERYVLPSVLPLFHLLVLPSYLHLFSRLPLVCTLGSPAPSQSTLLILPLPLPRSFPRGRRTLLLQLQAARAYGGRGHELLVYHRAPHARDILQEFALPGARPATTILSTREDLPSGLRWSF